MARARNIKPGFFKNELLGQADPLLSLLFVGLWTLADRRGILEDRPLRIKAELFPYRDVTDIAGYLTELERLGFLERFTANGAQLIHIQNFTKHQSPHPTEKPNDFPGIEKKDKKKQGVAELPVNSPLHNGILHVTAALNPYSLNHESLLTDSLNPEPFHLADKPQIKRRVQIPADFEPDETGVAKANESGIAVSTELERFKDYHRGKGSVMLDWQAAWRTWVGNAIKYGKAKSGHGQQLNARQLERKRVIKGLTGYDPDDPVHTEGTN